MLYDILIKSFKLCLHIAILFFGINGYSQTKPGDADKVGNIKAKRLIFDKSLGIDARRLIGDVQWESNGSIMRCDSAYMFSDKTIQAFSNVSIVKGDSVFFYGDSLRYDPNKKMAYLKGNVRCIDKEMTLTTNSLTYDLAKSKASYFNGGTIVSKGNTLKSKVGHYYSATKDVYFHYNVTLVSNDYHLSGDTLRYHSTSKTAYILGPTVIKNKENTIYCENGWYDTAKDISRFSKKARIVSSDQELLADSIFYDKKKGYFRATKNVRVIDTTHKSFILGNFAEHFEKGNRTVVSNRAVYGRIVEKDTLFISADTLYYNQPDSMKTFVKAFRHVKIFKKDIQGMCDSLVYASHDSIMKMYNSPILWASNGQVSAKLIVLNTNKEGIKSFELLSNAIVIQKVDSVDEFKFNQIEGKKMDGYFSNDTIRKLNVIGSAEIIYYVKQNKGYKGVNRTTCNDLTVWFDSEGVNRTTFRKKPQSTVFPIAQVKDEELRLKHFLWLENKRPKTKADIFLK